MKVAIAGIQEFEHVYNLFHEKKSKELEIVAFFDLINYNTTDWYFENNIPHVRLDELKEMYRHEIDAILICHENIRDVNLLAEVLFDSGMENIYIPYTYVLKQNIDFLGDNDFVHEYVYRPTWEKPFLTMLETHVTDLCNLKCKGCLHFSPLVDKEGPISNEQFEKDISRLSELFENILTFRLLGGEPLLNQVRLKDFIVTYRKHFKKTELQIFTNGLLIPKCTNELLNCIRENNVTVYITAYPPTLLMQKIIEGILRKNSIRYELSEPVERFTKFLTLIPHGSAIETHEKCPSKRCHALTNGKLARCSYSAYINAFNTKFDSTIHSNGLIDIYASKDGWEINDKLKSAIDMCEYCIPYDPVDFQWEQIGTIIKIEDWVVV